MHTDFLQLFCSSAGSNSENKIQTRQ